MLNACQFKYTRCGSHIAALLNGSHKAISLRDERITHTVHYSLHVDRICAERPFTLHRMSTCNFCVETSTFLDQVLVISVRADHDLS